VRIERKNETDSRQLGHSRNIAHESSLEAVDTITMGILPASVASTCAVPVEIASRVESDPPQLPVALFFAHAVWDQRGKTNQDRSIVAHIPSNLTTRGGQQGTGKYTEGDTCEICSRKVPYFTRPATACWTVFILGLMVASPDALWL
jgi:hypothetical protein